MMMTVPSLFAHARPLVGLLLAGISVAAQATTDTPALSTATASPPTTTAPSPALQIQPVEDDYNLALRAAQANDPAEALSRFLRVLGQDPQNLRALTGAGKAALDIGDANAAATFYARAQELSPSDGKIKAGLGSAMVQLLQPRAALKLFNDAVALGVQPGDIASDRGLAYDLLGDTRRARTDHELAMRIHPSPEATRRLAVSQAIAGDSLGAMNTLDGLLRRRDNAAGRIRAFILALGGDVGGADQAARAVLSRAQADALRPFLVRMAKLRPAEQAAAIHFGQFPAIGKSYSEEELASAAGITGPVAPVTSTLSRAMATAQKPRDALPDDEGDGIETEAVPVAGTPKDRLKDSGRPATPEEAAIAKAKWDQLLKEREAQAKARIAEKMAQLEADRAKEEEKARAAEKAKLDKKAGKDKPRDDKKPLVKDKADAAAKKKEPERYWVQIATGAYKPDLDKEWVRLKTKYPALLGRFSPWTTPLNRTNRLMVGPFKTDDEAQAFVNKAADGGFGTSRVSTPAGQPVERVR